MITDSNHIGIINPFRYRSYYYDEETHLYYLNSRYYNPEWGRFVNVDGIIGDNRECFSYNLYAYVDNNPIIFLDSMGTKKEKWLEKLKFALRRAVCAIQDKIRERKQKLQTLPDYSDELNALLKKNVSDIHSQWIGQIYFYDHVKNKGAWDYKRKDMWEKDISVPYLGPTGEFVFNGEIFTAEKFGNFNYGYVGTSIGFLPTTLFLGGGYANVGFSWELFGPYNGDSADDHYYIQKGISYYWETLMQELGIGGR